MGQVTISLQNGRQISFDVDVGLEGTAYFVLGVRKSGSSLLNKIAKELARLNRHNFVGVGEKFFRENVLIKDWQFDLALPEILHPANVYGGFRNMPVALSNNPLFESSPTVLIVRDPRDALVSEYFSNAYSHPIPGQTTEYSDTKSLMERERQEALKNGIDTYVVERAEKLVRTIVEYEGIAKAPRTLLLKYEDYIFDKRQLIYRLVEHFGWTVREQAIVNILRWADIRPEKEDPRAFIRKVTPGDHREKLQPTTIAKLNLVLRPAMSLLDYSGEE
jgi:Sulfotransferase domain